MPISKILVPVDYSDCSRAALVYAARLAKDVGASLEVIHIWDRPTYVADPVMVHQQGGATRSLIDMIRENAEQEMTKFLLEAKLPEGLAPAHRLLSGNPTSTILAELKEQRYDLLIVGTHGRTGLKHALLGSVAEKLVRLSPVPVLVVPCSS